MLSVKWGESDLRNSNASTCCEFEQIVVTIVEVLGFITWSVNSFQSPKFKLPIHFTLSLIDSQSTVTIDLDTKTSNFFSGHHMAFAVILHFILMISSALVSANKTSPVRLPRLSTYSSKCPSRCKRFIYR